MKLDFTKILILFLLVSTIGFGLIWYFGGFDKSKERVEELEEDYKRLEKEKEAAEAKITVWKEIFNEKDKQDKIMTQEVINAKIDANIARINAEKARAELIKIQNNMSITRREIEEMKNNPKEITNEELLEDLIKNTSTTQNINKESDINDKLEIKYTTQNINKESDINDKLEIKHKVESGETLYSLSKQYNITISEIKNQNKFLNKKGLQTGQILKIKTKN